MFKRILSCGCAVAVLLFTGLDARPLPAGARKAALKGLAAFFATDTGAVRDTNGDALPDTVVARVIVPSQPTADDAEAAANISARLGYETTALTLPLVLRESEVASPAAIALPILVGRGNGYVKKLVEKGIVDIKALRPGQGLISVVQAPLGGPDGLVVVGGDDAGTLAAGVELAARLPRVWNMTGITLTGIEQRTERFLGSRGIPGAQASLVSVVVDAERRGIASADVRVDVPAADRARATSAFEALDLAHRRGREERTLSYAEVAATSIQVFAGGQAGAKTEVRRPGLNSRTLTPPVDPDEFLPEPMGERGGPPEPRVAPAKPYDLSNALSIEGWFGDAYADLIPDRTDTTVILGGDAADLLGAAHITTRLGLESTGISLPITKRDEKVKEPPNEPSPILVGRTNTLVQQLVKIGKARLDDLQAGDGVIQIVPRAFANATATVVAGADPAGTEAASLYLARRVPYLWNNSRGSFTLNDLTDQASRFLGARSGAGQAGLALEELSDVLGELKGKSIESFEARLFLEKGDQGFADYVAGQVKAAFKDAEVKVSSQAVTEAVPVFEDKLDIPWEVDELRAKVASDVLPRIKTGARVDLEARLSESPKVREQVAGEIRAELAKAGAANPRVRIASAYKQGFFWLTEQVIPELKGKSARAIRIKIKSYKPDLSKKYKFYTVPSRWLHELYPVDEIFQRDLAIPVGAFSMQLVDAAKDTYSLEAVDGGGKVIHSSTFSPKVVEREYLDPFPGWSRVEVTTGWVTAVVDGQQALDARIQTDPERFWDYYQAKVLPKVYDHVMKVTSSKPTADKQPFFRDLDIEVWMSEPDYRIGIDEEQISSLEALHEDIYFGTLDFFAAMGRTLTKSRLVAPGKILPIIHPDRPGKPGQVRVLYAGNAASKPKLEISYKEKGGEKPIQVTKELSRVDTTPPLAVRAVVRPDRVSEIELQVEAKDDKEAGRAADAFDNLARLQAAGLYREALSFDHVDRVAFSIIVKDARTRRVIRNTGTTMASYLRVAQEKPGLPIVTWDHVIGPDEAEEVVRKLSAFPEVKAYRVGQSYRGRDLSVMELTLPTISEQVSVTKLTAYKPTIFMMGRQHANEVSSTSHILRLGELLVTDPKYREILKKVNVVLCPVMNPDGAQMAFELQKLTPTHMLHAGRYSALGMDVSSRTGNLLPEAEVEEKIWRQWLPDIYLNPHGYPSHEWVQPFSGYVPPGFRAYWSSRGWYTMLTGLRDPRYPDQEKATLALREVIVREINRDPDVRAMNLRNQSRYTRWAYGFAPHVYGLEVYKDTTIYYTDPETGEPRGSRRTSADTRGGSSRRISITAYPQVTFNSGMTEAPDETAQGAWLTLVTKAGFSFLMAHVDYLREGRYHIERIEEAGQRDSSSLTTLRVRPVMPGK